MRKPGALSANIPVERAVDDDVSSPIDFRSTPEAQEWAAAAMAKRPWRVEFFAAIAEALTTSGDGPCRVLELGSGPGFLAEYLLRSFPRMSYLALDFSAAMHELAATRLGDFVSRVEFVERSFREPNWEAGLGRFDSVVTMQAVHELRHKRHASTLHGQVYSLLVPGGSYFVCDHFAGAGAQENSELFMTVDEQREALHLAGFEAVHLLLLKGGMVLHRAVAAAE